TRCVTRITRSLESANARTEDRESNEAVRRFAAAEGNGSRYCARPSSFKRSINLDSKAAISCNRCLKDFLLNLCYGQGANWLHILGVEFMKNVVEFRAQATLCRQLAMCEPKNSIYWLAEAERWECLAHDEISSHYQDCNVGKSAAAMLPQSPAQLPKL